MTLRSYLRVLRERWKLLLLFVFVATAAAAAITVLTPKSYQATAQVLVSTSVTSDPSLQVQAQAYVATEVATYAQVIQAPDVVKFVQNDLHLAIDPNSLKDKLSADASTGQSIINVHATDGDAAQAADIANSAARGLVKYVAGVAPQVKLFVTSPADQPGGPISPKPTLNIVLGVILGLLIGAALAVIRDILDNRVKDAEALAKVAETGLMGVIVEDPKTDRHPVASRGGLQSARAENFRQLRANLQFANVDKHPRVIAVTSSIAEEGKTTVAVNLASTLAETGFSVCLIDADLRRPNVAKALGLVDAVGLTSVLIHQMDIADALQDAGKNLKVLAAGPMPPNPSELLASAYVREVVRSLLGMFDYIVLDTAPLLPVADGSEVAALSDGVLLVARHGTTTDVNVRRSVEALRRVDAVLIGTVLNRVPVRRSAREYGYEYYGRTDSSLSRDRDGKGGAHSEAGASTHGRVSSTR